MRQEHTACPASTGKRCELTIDDLGIHGEGIGKYEGFTLFIPVRCRAKRSALR